jgi:DNA-directed RNA polymerase subunit RPC12/RpoP
MIKFRCSNCNKKFGVPDDYAGQRIRCNTCDCHTIVPKPGSTAAEQLAASKPGKDASKADGDFVLILPSLSSDEASNEPESQPAQMQLQSFHNYSTPKPDTHEPASADAITQAIPPAVKQGGKSIWKRRWFDSDPELTLNILSYISCIGPVLFIAMFFYVMMALAVGDSPRAMAAHHAPPAEPNVVSTSDPNTLSKYNPFSALSASRAVRYSFYAVCFGISPIALILSLILVFRYAFDMPKTLYFSLVVYGLIFFTIFKG